MHDDDFDGEQSHRDHTICDKVGAALAIVSQFCNVKARTPDEDKVYILALKFLASQFNGD